MARLRFPQKFLEIRGSRRLQAASGGSRWLQLAPSGSTGSFGGTDTSRPGKRWHANTFPNQPETPGMARLCQRTYRPALGRSAVMQVIRIHDNCHTSIYALSSGNNYPPHSASPGNSPPLTSVAKRQRRLASYEVAGLRQKKSFGPQGTLGRSLRQARVAALPRMPLQYLDQNTRLLSMIAFAKASGASCGRLCPMPPVMWSMLVPADVLLRIDFRIGMRCAIRVPFQGDCRTSDIWKCRDLLLQFIIFSFAGLKAQIPAVIVERDMNEIRIFKSLCGALERFIIERPLR